MTEAKRDDKDLTAHFGTWSDKSLITLHPDYVRTHQYTKKMLGENHPETVMYRKWLAAMAAEMHRRGLE